MRVDWRGYLLPVLRFALLAAGAALAGTVLQLLVQPPVGGGAEVAVLALGAACLVVLPALLLVGFVTCAAMRLAERGGAPRAVVRLAGAALAGGLAYGLLAGGLWWVISAYGWAALVVASALGAAWLLPRPRPSRPGV